MKVKSESEVAQLCPTVSDPVDCSHQAPPSLGLTRQEHWSGLPLPSPSGRTTVLKSAKSVEWTPLEGGKTGSGWRQGWLQAWLPRLRKDAQSDWHQADPALAAGRQAWHVVCSHGAYILVWKTENAEMNLPKRELMIMINAH